MHKKRHTNTQIINTTKSGQKIVRGRGRGGEEGQQNLVTETVNNEHKDGLKDRIKNRQKNQNLNNFLCADSLKNNCFNLFV